MVILKYPPTYPVNIDVQDNFRQGYNLNLNLHFGQLN